jgi:hypothetical protein
VDSQGNEKVETEENEGMIRNKLRNDKRTGKMI